MDKVILRQKEVNYIFVEANPSLGFNFPFVIFIPKELNDKPELIYAWNLLGFKDEYNFPDSNSIRKASSSFDPMMWHLTFDLGNPCILSLIPRMNYFRPNFMGKEFLENDFSPIAEWAPEEEMEEIKANYSNLPDQIVNSINYGQKVLSENNINVDNQVVMTGYSEGAKGSSHFALLHPEVIKALVLGGTGGCISMPISEYQGYTFNFPTGINDVPNFNRDRFNDIDFFYYMGDTDRCDSAMPLFEKHHYIDENGEDQILKDENGNPTPIKDENGNVAYILDENGNYRAMHSLFTDDEVNSINKALGTVTQDRFKVQESIYDNLGLNATFILYHGNHRTVLDEPERSKLFKDVDNFLNDMKKNKCK